jgi:acylpyruvate hydrolase
VKLATIRLGGGTTVAVRVEEEAGEAVELAAPDVGALLNQPDWAGIAERGEGRRLDLASVSYAPVVPCPGKVICVGLNYRTHLREQGMAPPAHPTLFAKYGSALTGAYDDIVLPSNSQAVDWEVELAVVVGSTAKHVDVSGAVAAIAGYAVMNDVSMRDWQYRTSQFLQGKTFDASTPFGPWLVTRDDPSVSEAGMGLYCEVDGERVQEGSTDDMVFGPAELISYISGAITLRPGDVISSGTPGGCGHWREPPRYLQDGNVLVSKVAGVGECRNLCRREKERN